MKEIHLTRKELNKFTVFNKGGYEGKILIYSPKILLKEFEPYLSGLMDMEGKKKKIMCLQKKNISEQIMIKPQKIVYTDGIFCGYTMKKISDAVEVDSIRDIDLLLDLYIKLFSNLNALHENEIIVGDLKPSNILVDKNNNNPIFIDVDSMGVDEFKIDNEDYRSKNTRKFLILKILLKRQDVKILIN